MTLYSGAWTSFVVEATRNQIAETLRLAFRQYYGHDPSISESTSWRMSLLMLANVGQYAELSDHGIMIEYQLPLASKRLDAMILGHDKQSQTRGIVVELKQWEKCKPADGERQVWTYVGGREREVNHPSEQVRGYVEYLQNVHTTFQGADAIALDGCGYLHNYHVAKDVVLNDVKFASLLQSYPLFGNDDHDALAAYLHKGVGSGGGVDLLQRVQEGIYRPSRKLMMHVAEVIEGQQHYILLDEQRVVYDKVRALVNTRLDRSRKQIVIVKGGPGTGKSVIALKLMADLSRDGRSAQYATGSKSFTETLREIVGKQAATQFSYFNKFMKAPYNALDVLICDEAHRIRNTSNDRFTRKELRSDGTQLEELLHVSRVLVLFIDDHQTVRPNEIGSVQYILDHAAAHPEIDVHDYELTTQFRCGGSEKFIDWVNDTLGIMKTASPVLESTPDFEFRICDSPIELQSLIRQRVEEGFTARMTAGFCWPWSNPTAEGDLVEDVVVGDWKQPWNARPDAGRLKPGIPKASLWAYHPGGVDQVGCIYTAQGFEFDFAGVIIGPDLTYDLDKGTWQGHPTQSKDSGLRGTKDLYLDYARNLYRVLLTRGMKGCYVYFVDKDTERFFRSRMR